MSRHHPFAASYFFDKPFRYNENHDPDTGQFSSGSGGSGGSNSGGETLYSDVGKKVGKDAEKGSGSKAETGVGPALSGADAQGSPRTYEGKSPRNDQGSGRLTGASIRRVFTPTAEQAAKLAGNGAAALTFNELGQGGAAVFHTLIGEAKQANKYGAAVTLYPVEDYEHARLFITDDGHAGFALKGDDIISVFKNPVSKDRSVVASILPLAVQEGGKRLDCFDTALPHIYGNEGFRAVSRTAFDEQYQPEGWDKKLFTEFNGGKPDVVFMVRDAKAAPYKAGDGKAFGSYDDAMAAQLVASHRSGRPQSFRSFADAFAFDKYFDRYNENHDPDTGQFSSGSGATSSDVATSQQIGAASDSKHSGKGESAKSDETKGKTKLADFEVNKIALHGFNNKIAQDKFVDQWDERIGETPAAFKAQFLGGVDASMTIGVQSDNEWHISGSVHGPDQRDIGTYRRELNLRTKTAESAFFQLNRGTTDKAIGKKFLAGNIATYQKMGIDKVKVHANIDVGGYAWARYGYVPTQDSWRSLSASILRKLGRDGSTSGRPSSGSTYTPESWSELGDDEQDEIKQHYLDDTRQEYVDSEIQSWRDNGGALDDAKYQLAENFSTTYQGKTDYSEWAVDAVTEYVADRADGAHPVPYTAKQILNAISIEDYETGYEGRKDAEFSFDDDKLREPSDAPPKEQMMLPGFKPDDLSKHLTDDMRDDITKALVEAFNDKAEKDADDVEPPDYLSENVADYQSESWDGMRDRDKFDFAERGGYLPEREIEPDEDEENHGDDDEPVVPASDDANASLERLAQSNNPKALWAIADSPRGKELLLNSDWYGTLNLKDPETMARFNAYVGKVKAA